HAPDCIAPSPLRTPRRLTIALGRATLRRAHQSSDPLCMTAVRGDDNFHSALLESRYRRTLLTSPRTLLRAPTEFLVGTGLTCGSCHATTDSPASYGPRAPPGAPNWHLPPPSRKMVFIGLSSGELCRGLKDRTANGGKGSRSSSRTSPTTRS